MTDRKQNDGNVDVETEQPMLSRRKLAYVAPLLMSRRMFYRASGCGKINPSGKVCNDFSGS